MALPRAASPKMDECAAAFSAWMHRFDPFVTAGIKN